MKHNIAFIGWNPFQFYHFLPLLKELPQAKFIVEVKKHGSLFHDELFTGYQDRMIMVSQHEMGKLDGAFDLIVCQTPFEKIYQIEQTPIAMLQYGYAKEPHNYGAWRAFADVNLVYGEYAAEKISHYSPVQITGNPSYDEFHFPEMRGRVKEKYQKKINNSKKVLVYAPTWGDLSSINGYLDSLVGMSELYNIIIKVHHNTHIINSELWSKIKELPNIIILGANDSLLEVIYISDVVVSDYSGAIFDAIYFKKPVVLLDVNHNSEKIDKFSIEYTMRPQLGVNVSSTEALPQAVQFAIKFPEKSIVSSKLRENLFFETHDSVNHAIKVLIGAIKGEYKLNQNQLYVRDSLKALYRNKDDYRNYKSKHKTLFTRIKSFGSRLAKL